MDANVRVSGFVIAAIGDGITEYAHMLIMPDSLRGRITRGSRIKRERRVERHIVPAIVYNAWISEAWMTVRAEGAGTVLR